MGFISEIYSRDMEAKPLVEALRFTGKEREQISKTSDNFRIGLEYEFNVNGGRDYVDALDAIVNRGASKKLTYFRSSWEMQAIKMGDYVIQLQRQVKSVSIQALIDELTDMIFSMSADDVDYIDQNIMPDVLPILSTVRSIIGASSVIIRHVPARSLLGIPMWTDMSFVTINQMKTAQTAEGMYYMDPPEAKKVVSNVVGILHSIENYISTPEFSKYRTSASLSSDISELAMEFFYRTNPEERQDQGETKIEIVRRTHPIPPELLQGVVFDSSVPKGAELVTRPLRLSQLRSVMDVMANYIQEIGGTDRTTGLHVNISTKNNDFDPIKAITMLDLDFFQNMSPGSKVRPKYDPRIMVENISNMLGANAQQFAMVYINYGEDALVARYEEVIRSIMSAKGYSVNLKHFFDAARVDEQRVEFRFFGGPNYERKTDELYDDILNVMYVISASGMVSNRDYKKQIIRLLDRGVRKKGLSDSFSGVVNMVRKKRL